MDLASCQAHCERMRTLATNIAKILEGFLFASDSEIPGLMKPLLLFGMRISSKAHGMMAGRRPLAVLESWRASQM